MKFIFGLFPKTFSAFLIVSLLPFLVLVNLISHHSASMLKKQIREELVRNTSNLLDQLATEVTSMNQNAWYWNREILKMGIDFSGVPQPPVNQYLKEMMQTYGTFGAIYCVNLEGLIVAANNKEIIGKKVLKENWFPKALKGESGVGDLAKSIGQEVQVIPFYFPFQTEEGAILGVFVLEYLWTDLFLKSAMKASVEKKDGEEISLFNNFILDERGFIVSAPLDWVGEFGEDLFRKNLVAEGSRAATLAIEGGRGTVVEVKEGREYLVGYCSLPSQVGKKFRWVALSYVSLNEILKPVHVLTRWLYMFGAGSVVVIFVFSLFFASKITRPVRRLILATQDIMQGKKVADIGISGKDEIGTLAKTFQEMDHSLTDIKEKLVHAGRLAAVGELAAGVAHEINNPLTAILGHAQILSLQAEAAETISSKTVQEACKIIENSSMRCKAITEGLLSFARKGSRKQERVDLNELIETTLGLVTKQLQLDNVTVEKHWAPSLPSVLGNKVQLQQVVLNLISNAHNAVVAKKVSGKLILSTTFNRQKNEVTASVQDNGIGISKENREKVFQPFFTTKSPGKGTGLGLAICYGIMKDHGGDIRFETEEGKGSTFILVFPVVSAGNNTVAHLA